MSLLRKSLTETITLRAAITVRERLAKRYHGIINLTKNLCFIDNDGNERPYSDIYEYDPARVENHQASNAHLRRTTGVDREAFIAIEWVIYLLIIIALLTPYFITAVRQRFFAKCIRRRKKARRERKLQLEELTRRQRDPTRVILPIKIPQRKRIFLRNIKVDPVSLPESVPEFAVREAEQERSGFEDDLRSYDTLDIFEDRPSEVRLGNVHTSPNEPKANEDNRITESRNSPQLWKVVAAVQKQKSVNVLNQPHHTAVTSKTSQVPGFKTTKFYAANTLKSVVAQGRAQASPQVHQEQSSPPQSVGRGTTVTANQNRKSQNGRPSMQPGGRQSGPSPGTTSGPGGNHNNANFRSPQSIVRGKQVSPGNNAGQKHSQ